MPLLPIPMGNWFEQAGSYRKLFAQVLWVRFPALSGTTSITLLLLHLLFRVLFKFYGAGYKTRTRISWVEARGPTFRPTTHHLGCEPRTRTGNLQVMSLLRYHCANSHLFFDASCFLVHHSAAPLDLE